MSRRRRENGVRLAELGVAFLKFRQKARDCAGANGDMLPDLNVTPPQFAGNDARRARDWPGLPPREARQGEARRSAYESRG